MAYQIGKFYNFTFQESYVASDGNTLLRLTDPNNPDYDIHVKPYDFQIDWENNIFQKIKCYCKSQSIYGKYKFELSRDEMLEYLYGSEVGHYKTFVIKNKIQTDNNKICCYISDAYGYSQRYFPKDNEFWEKHQVEEDIILLVKEIRKSTEGRNDACLMLEAHEDVNHQNSYIHDTQKKPFIRDEKKVSLGVEDDYKEFKSSIAFPAGGTVENMPEQLRIITQSIAGFMNKNGGSLYIGVNDSGEPFKDISEEFQYLNDDENDKYTYNSNEDHYKLKLHNKIRCYLGDYATSLVKIVFHEANGVKYAEIKVDKATSVVWHSGTKLFVRCDNCTRQMKGDSITNFILSRVKPNVFKEIINQPLKEEDIQDDSEPMVPQAIEKPVEIKKEKTTNEEKPWRYISFFKDGQWSFRKQAYPREEELLAEMPIPSNPKSYILMIAYMSGKINAVALKDLLYGTGAKKNTLIASDTIRNNGIPSTDDQVVSIFCMKKGGIILMESIANGETFIKAHNIDVVSIHQNLNAQGNKMLPGGSLIRIAPIESDTAEISSVTAMGLLVKDYERYHRNGVSKMSLQGKYQVLLNNLLNNSGNNLKGECANIDVTSLKEQKDETNDNLSAILPNEKTASTQTEQLFSVDESDIIIEAIIKDRLFKFTLDGTIPYERFENKKVYNFKHDIYYTKMGKDIFIFLSQKKASELDTEQSSILRLRGNGEDPRFSQDFSHINGDITKQQDNNSRIFVFAHHDDKTCKFYDELRYLGYDMEQEEDREIIMFKMKSLYRFNSNE